jgi:hypothetical protein
MQQALAQPQAEEFVPGQVQRHVERVPGYEQVGEEGREVAYRAKMRSQARCPNSLA